MFSDQRFESLQERFEQVKNQYKQMIEEKQGAATKKIISKGRMYNILPYESEQKGEKLKGKVLPEPINHNDCYIYHLDEQGRVLLYENISEFLKIPAYFSLYTYHENFIEHIYGDNRGPYRLERAYLNEGVVKEILCWAKESSIMELFGYDSSVLKNIHHFQKSHKQNIESSFDLVFHYNQTDILSCIHRIWPSGRAETIFSSAKINFKSFRQRLFIEIENEISNFLREHECEHFTRFALDCYSGHGYVSLCMNTDQNEQWKDSPADWTYCDFASLPLIEFPLDDGQTEKLHKAALQIAMDLLKGKCLQPLRINHNFSILVFDHNELLGEEA